MKKRFYVFIFLILAGIAIGSVYGWRRYAATQPAPEMKKFKVGLLQFAPIVSQNMDGFKAGLKELGYQEGTDIEYIYRDAQGDLDAVKRFADELAHMKLDLIFANTSPATAAIKEATADTGVPVVFSMVADPIGAKFVQNVVSSGNNLTGTSCAYIEIAAKRLEILHEAAPLAKKVLVFYRPADLSAGPCTDRIISKAPELGMEIINFPISQKEDIEAKLSSLKPGEIDAIMDPGDSMVSSVMGTIVKYSLALKVPYMALSKGEVEGGATIGYAVDYLDLGKQSSLIANQVLTGIKPSDIPFELPRKWFFAINQDSAQKIGLVIPNNVLEKADLVIEPQNSGL